MYNKLISNTILINNKIIISFIKFNICVTAADKNLSFREDGGGGNRGGIVDLIGLDGLLEL